MIKKITTTLVLILFNVNSSSIIAQETNSIEKILNEQNLKLRIERDNPGGLQTLNIYKLNNDSLIKSSELDTEFDLRNFGPYYSGQRKFIVIDGRYSFFIVNTSTYKLIGPFRGSNRGGAHDAQSYMVGYFNIFNNGQYLTFASFDYGVYCYNLMDLYHPKETEMFFYRTKGFNEIYFFLDKRNDSIYNGIKASYEINRKNIYSREITPEFLFQGYKFKIDSSGQILKKQVKEKYLILYRLTTDETAEPFIIDFDNGAIIDKNTNKSLYNELISEI